MDDRIVGGRGVAGYIGIGGVGRVSIRGDSHGCRGERKVKELFRSVPK